MVITGLLAYSFILYKWHISLLKHVEQWCQNFSWIGDILKKGIATVNWDRICVRMYDFKLEGGGGEWFQKGFRKLFSLE